ncbi:short chain dehydrogenase [Colletotrichum salicis]|uniref:Short chain dehydrogenase n=1 Tax=Colletotrichum salicis TaxID=1209931 RepID=A0A135V9Z0_9PEZI|nr:short chain dehydrogenase [Colletotrichum salicis]
MTTKYPKLDCLILNAGIQNTFVFTPALLETAKHELRLNYLSPLVTTTHILSHFESLFALPTAVILVTSGLAIVPMPRCANYCASKAALRSLAWSLRAQLADRGTRAENIRVIEVVPPAVRTELHSRQADLVAAGRGDVGMPLEEFIDEMWGELDKGETEDVIIGQAKYFVRGEDERKKAFDGLVTMVKGR